ncbi:hypothetical protein FOZ63_011507, partial [Perkinsus olseni]
LQITPLDGKKAFTADKCLFTISTPLQGSQQQTNSKDKKQQQQPMKLYFVEGPHCGTKAGGGRGVLIDVLQKGYNNNNKRDKQEIEQGKIIGPVVVLRQATIIEVVVVLATGYVVNLGMTLYYNAGGKTMMMMSMIERE